MNTSLRRTSIRAYNATIAKAGKAYVIPGCIHYACNKEPGVPAPLSRCGCFLAKLFWKWFYKLPFGLEFRQFWKGFGFRDFYEG